MKPNWIARRTSEALLAEAFPPRLRDSHKGDYGKVLIVAGCKAYSGAAVLAARAAVRSGSGLVMLAVPEAIWEATAARLDSAVVFPVPCDYEGRFCLKSLPILLEKLSQADACLIGPGIGRSAELRQVVFEILRTASVPVVLDADGLNAVASHIDILREAACPVVMTPHEGEFARLVRDGDDDRVQGAISLARQTDAVVLRKGCRTVITDGNLTYINTTGNPGLATGGSGDVLAGILVSVLGRGIPPLKAAAAAAWVHGVCGDICVKHYGQYALSAGDLPDALCALLP